MSESIEEIEERLGWFEDEIEYILGQLYNADKKAERLAKKQAAGKSAVEYERARVKALEGICFMLHGRLLRAMKEGLNVEYWMSF